MFAENIVNQHNNRTINKIVIISPRLYLILLSIAVALLFFSFWQIKPAIVNINDFLGLVSHFTVFYWTGLLIVLACSIAIYFDVKIKNSALFILTLIIAGFFL